MHFITDRENPDRILAAFRDALPAGSYLALSHATADDLYLLAHNDVTGRPLLQPIGA